MTTKHTPGPWETRAFSVFGQSGIDGELIQVASTFQGLGNDRQADAERIAACVNACEGINPEAVKDLLEALKTILRIEDGDLQPGDEVIRRGSYESWSGLISRVNEKTYTVKRSDGKVQRWGHLDVYPTDKAWKNARAAIAKAEGGGGS